jgi:hypothetical protein
MKQLLRKGQVLEHASQISRNVIVQALNVNSENDDVVVIGTGNSLSLDEDNVVVKRDPLMSIPDYLVQFFPNRTVYVFYYTFECKGLNSASKDLANFINLNLREKNVLLIGHSKSALCCYMATQHISNINMELITVSAPYKGTVVADAKLFNRTPKRFSGFLKIVHKLVYSGHKVDYDIAPNSPFIKRLKSLKSADCCHINVISTLQNSYNCRTIKEKFCYFLQWCLNVDGKQEGDGIVSLQSQKIDCKRECRINASHENSLRIALEHLSKMQVFD